MRRNPSRHKAKPNNPYPLSPPSSANSPLDMSLEYAQQRANQSEEFGKLLPHVDLTATTAPEITPLDALLSTRMPDPQWIVPELLPVGITLLTGKQGVGKSWLAFKLALAIATNIPVLGYRPVAQGCVLYLGLEENRYRTLDRAAKILQGQPAPNALNVADNWHPLAAGGLADIEDWLDAHETARLVVIDSLISVYTKNRSHHRSGSKARENTIMIPLKVIANMHQIAILIIQHLEQANTFDFAHDGSFVNKAASYMDIADGMLLLTQERDTQETRLHITGQQRAEKVMTVN